MNLSYKTQSTNKILLQYFQNLKIIMSKIMAWLLEIIHRRWTVSHGKSFLSFFQITPNHCSGKNMHPQHEWHHGIETLNFPWLFYNYLKQISEIVFVLDRQKTSDIQSEQQHIKRLLWLSTELDLNALPKLSKTPTVPHWFIWNQGFLSNKNRSNFTIRQGCVMKYWRSVMFLASISVLSKELLQSLQLYETQEDLEKVQNKGTKQNIWLAMQLFLTRSKIVTFNLKGPV